MLLYATGSVGLEYTVSGNVCNIVGIGTCTDTDIVIPSRIDGYEVVSVANYAFQNNTNITSVVIPETVKIIDSNAFYGCTSLACIELSEGLKSIGKYSFYGCTALQSIAIPDGVEYIYENAFYSCVNLSELSLGEGLIEIGDLVFYKCNFTKVVLPNSLKVVGSSAFLSCEKLEDVTVGSRTEKILYQAFGSTNLKSIAYNGSITEWKNIELDTLYDRNTPPYTIYCIDGTISSTGEWSYY